MNGILYGVSVGPGDPELMTLKAVRIIRQCAVVAVPRSGADSLVALEIAQKTVPEAAKKERLELYLPMTRDHETLERTRAAAAQTIADTLQTGRDVAFLTLGDVSIYSTYLYLHERVKALGFMTEMIAGVPSFCAAAARLGDGLTKAHQPLHVIPASYAGVDDGLGYYGTKVLMKTGKAFAEVKEKLRDRGLYPHSRMVEKCGMEGERVYESLDDAGEDSSYFSILIVKDN